MWRSSRSLRIPCTWLTLARMAETKIRNAAKATRSALRHRRGWGYIGVALGGLASVAANVAHSFVPPSDVSSDWAPHAGAVIGAATWPVALFVAIEILAHTDWPAGHRWLLLRFGGLGLVALVAAIVSYRHMSGLLAFYGEDSLTVRLGPLAVDGLMVMALGALVAASRPLEPAPTVQHDLVPQPFAPTEPAAVLEPERVPDEVNEQPAKPSDMREDARQRFANGEDCAAIAKDTDVSLRTVQLWVKDLRKTASMNGGRR